MSSATSPAVSPSARPALWSVRLLGGLAVRGRDGREVTRLRTRKVGAALALLSLRAASSGAQALPRERLCALLWPDAPEEAARHNLSNALTVLRQSLEPPGVPPGSVIEADRHSVRLRPGAFACDAAEFESAAGAALALPHGAVGRAPALAAACALYAGPLLPGLADEGWASEEATRLSSLFLRAAAAGASGLLDAGDAAGALALAGRALAEDPVSEEALSCLMRAHLSLGEPSAAHSAFRRYERRLQADTPGEEAPDALRELARTARRAAGGTATAAHEGTESEADEGAPASPAVGRHVGPSQDVPQGVLADATTLSALTTVTTTRFFGREAEMGRLMEMLSAPRTRLVTVTGAGGTGKTRLALEAAAAAVAGGTGAGAAPSAVFVPLADLTEGGQVPGALLRALGVPPDPGRGPREQAAAVLSAGPPGRLLVFDNFEQLVDAGGTEELSALLAATPPGIKLLVTSRARLQVAGEHEFRLAPLPTTGGAKGLGALAAVPSVALFVDRAQMARHDFELTEKNAATVAALVDRLEGVPLALEIAAARAAALSPAQMLAQLDASPLDGPALTSTRRDVTPRHKSLRATLDWSYGLLAPEACGFLADLSVFRGGCTLETASAVSPGAVDALEMLTQLRDASLVNVSDDEEGIRFSLLEPVRQYAAEKLEGGGAAWQVHERHLSWCVALAEEFRLRSTGPDERTWLERLDAEHDNLRAALRWGAQDERGSGAALRMAGALYQFWQSRGLLQEGRHLTERALASAGGQAAAPSARALALKGVGSLSLLQGDFASARAFYEESVTIFKATGDKEHLAAVLNDSGHLSMVLRALPAARAMLEESLAISRESDNPSLMADSLNSLANVEITSGDYASARALYEESLSLYRRAGKREKVATVLANLGKLAVAMGDYDTAQGPVEEALRVFRELGNRPGIATVLGTLGEVAHHRGDYAAARTLLEESLEVNEGVGNKLGCAAALNRLGGLAHLEGDHAAAQERQERCLRIGMEIGNVVWVSASLADLAGIATARGEARKAARLLGASAALREAAGGRTSPAHQKRFDLLAREARELLGEDFFSAAWEEGRSLTREQAATYALGAAGPR